MFGTVIFVCALALVQSRPDSLNDPRLWEPSELCPPIHEHYLLPHEYDCTKYYYCEYGMKYIQPRDCSPGTEFSYEIQVCIHPEQANCNLPGPPAPTTTTTSTTTTTTTTTPAPTTTSTTTTTTTPAPTTTSTTTTTTTPAPTTTSTTTTTAAPPTSPSGGDGDEDCTDENGSGDGGSGDGGDNGGGCTGCPGTLPNGCPADWREEQLFPHETRCDAFYQCTHGNLVEMPCAPGTHFNFDKQECDWPHLAGCENGGGDNGGGDGGGDNGGGDGGGDNGGGDNGGGCTGCPGTLPNGCPADWREEQLFPHETRCDAFYQCTHGNLVEMPCAPGTHFNFDKQECDWPHLAGCENGGGDNGGGDGGGDNGGGDGGGDNGGGDNGGGCTGCPGTLPNGCPADWREEQLFPHETRCDAFYQCTHGNLVEMPCAPGTHFNFDKQECDWPHLAGCENGGGDNGGGDNGGGDNGGGDGGGCTGCPGGGSGEDGGGDNGGGDNGGGDNGGGDNGGGDNGGGCTGCPGTLPNGCPADWREEQLFPHETRCDAFYQCTHGNLVEMPCAPGTHFNFDKQECDWPHLAGCENGGGDNGGGDGGGDNGGGDGGGDNGGGDGGGDNGGGDNGGGCTGCPGTLPNGCPADWREEQLLPHETRCDAFYQCTHGNLVEMPCAPGTHFNFDKQECDWPHLAGCENGGGDNGGGDGGGDNGGGDGGGDNGGGDNGGGCTGCPGTLPNGCPADWREEQLLPHETRCDAFYQCTHGNLVEMPCAPGTHFNFDKQECDWPHLAGCENGGGDNGGGDGGGDNGGGDGGGDNGGGDNGTGCPGCPGTLPNGCLADWNIHNLLPHETDCDKFYQCVHGNLVEMPCAPGTHFNPVLQVCDWPENAGCASGGGDNGGCTGCPPGGESGENGGGDNGGSGENGGGDNGGSGENGGGDNGGSGENGGGENGGSGENGGGENGGGDESCECEDGGTDCEVDYDARCRDNCNILPWAHATDCDKFWRCEGDKAVRVVCPEGLHFNPNTAGCDFICNAGCVRRYTTTTTYADGLKIFVPFSEINGASTRLQSRIHKAIEHAKKR